MKGWTGIFNRYGCWGCIRCFPDVKAADPNFGSIERFVLRVSLGSFRRTEKVKFLSHLGPVHGPNLITNNLLEEPEFKSWMSSGSRSHRTDR